MDRLTLFWDLEVLVSRMLVRPLCEDDLDDIAWISRSIWDGGDYIPSVAPAWLKEGGFYGGELDGRIVGTFRMTLMPTGVLWFEGLRIHSDLQGQGFGRILADRALEIGDSIITEGYANCQEFCTYIFNVESLEIARSQGFEVVNGFLLLVRDGPFLPAEVREIEASSTSIPDRGGHIPCGWKHPRYSSEGIRWTMERSIQLACGSARMMKRSNSETYIPLRGSAEYPYDLLNGVEGDAFARDSESAELILHSSQTEIIEEAYRRGWGMWKKTEENNILVLRRIPSDDV